MMQLNPYEIVKITTHILPGKLAIIRDIIIQEDAGSQWIVRFVGLHDGRSWLKENQLSPNKQLNLIIPTNLLACR